MVSYAVSRSSREIYYLQREELLAKSLLSPKVTRKVSSILA